MGRLHEALKDLVAPPSEAPHVTVVYGPQASVHGEDVTGVAEAMDRYPDVAGLEGGGTLVLTCRGIGVFDRPHQGRWIVHLRVTCPALSTLRARTMARYPAVAEAATAAMNAAIAAEASNVLSFSPVDEGPDHFWAHLTLGTFPTAEAAARAVEVAEAALRNIDFPPVLFVDGFTAVSATSDTFTRLLDL
jgi:hypothetical protein